MVEQEELLAEQAAIPTCMLILQHLSECVVLRDEIHRDVMASLPYEYF